MRVREILLTNQGLQDLNPLFIGEEHCLPGHVAGPFIRNYVLLHYVVKGKGTFYARDGVFPVEQGNAFLILPGEVTTYIADTDDPWYYLWIAFDGNLSAHFAQLPPVFPLPSDTLNKMLQIADTSTMAEYRLAAELLQMYAFLFAKNIGNRHVSRVENYIQSAYMHPIRVEHIANQLNLDRRYLSRLFKEKTGLSIQEYLISVRLKEAEHYLKEGRGVKETAHLVGYEDVSNFSKIFKKRYGKNPAAIRRS